MLRGRESILGNNSSILLDTSFLLPTLGIDVEDDVYRALELLKKTNLFYLEAGLLEALWVAIRFSEKIPLKTIEEGIEAIRRDYILIHPSGKSFADALMIYKLGHRDFIDALHYTTALNHNIKLLTIDKQFINFLKQNNYKLEGIVLTPKDLLHK